MMAQGEKLQRKGQEKILSEILGETEITSMRTGKD